MSNSQFDKNMKYVSMILLIFFTTAQILYVRVARTQPGEKYNTESAVIVGEVMKLVLSFLLLSNEKRSIINGFQTLRTELRGSLGMVLLQGVPALLYTVQNNCMYIAISNLDAAVYQVTAQLKLITAAIFTVTMLGKKITFTQWISLVLLGAGVVLVQYNPNAADIPKKDINPTVGIVAVLISCTTSGFAGVFMERMFKDNRMSVWSRNFWLALFSVFVGCANILRSDIHGLSPATFFKGFSNYAWIAVILLAVGGLIIAMVLKYADNILKAFGNAASILVSSIVSVILFDFVITRYFLFGCVLVMVAIVMYTYGGKRPEYKKIPDVETTQSVK